MKSRLLIVLGLLLFLTAMSQAQVIVIDPGHGGSEPGAVGNTMEEADVVLDTSTRFRALLEADTIDKAGGGSWAVSMTRDSDVFISLAGRSAYANSIDADRFMSIHANAHETSQANGTETFSYSSSGTGAALRNLVQEEMVDAWQRTNRGNKTANFSVLRNTAMPAVLHELAFISNPGDAVLLSSPNARQSAAAAHLRALQRHYGIVPYVPGETTTEDPGSILVRVTGEDGGLAGAEVTVDGDEVGSTDGVGEIRIDSVAVGEHIIGASKSGYLASDTVAVVFTGEEALALIEMNQGVSGEDPTGRTGQERCDALGTCNPHEDDSLPGGCSTTSENRAPSWALFFLVLGLWYRSTRERRQPQPHVSPDSYRQDQHPGQSTQPQHTSPAKASKVAVSCVASSAN